MSEDITEFSKSMFSEEASMPKTNEDKEAHIRALGGAVKGL